MISEKFLRAAPAVLIAAAISTGTFLLCGIGLPNWIFGSERITKSADGSTIEFIFVSFASIYSLVGFIVLAVFLYRKFETWPKHIGSPRTT